MDLGEEMVVLNSAAGGAGNQKKPDDITPKQWVCVALGTIAVLYIIGHFAFHMF